MTRARAGSHLIRITCALVLVLSGWLSGAAFAASLKDQRWQELAPGLETITYQGDGKAFSKDAEITIVRADPERWEPAILCAAVVNEGQPLTAREWCQAHQLHAATNAGMFAKDGQTHVGYLRCGDYVNSRRVNTYQSAVAFSPKQPGLPPVRVFDLDVTPLDEVLTSYQSVAQNLRLVQRPGINRWSPQERMWSEAALGQDRAGRLLLIFCPQPFSMYEFNRILLALPIDLECAQHLEGGPEAQLFICSGQFEREYVGSYETGFNETQGVTQAWPIPNALGIRPRSAGGQ
jgi:hypothetical protein